MGWRVWVPPHMSVTERGNPYHVKGYWRRAIQGEGGAVPDAVAKLMPVGPPAGSPLDQASKAREVQAGFRPGQQLHVLGDDAAFAKLDQATKQQISDMSDAELQDYAQRAKEAVLADLPVDADVQRAVNAEIRARAATPAAELDQPSGLARLKAARVRDAWRKHTADRAAAKQKADDAAWYANYKAEMQANRDANMEKTVPGRPNVRVRENLDDADLYVAEHPERGWTKRADPEYGAVYDDAYGGDKGQGYTVRFDADLGGWTQSNWYDGVDARTGVYDSAREALEAEDARQDRTAPQALLDKLRPPRPDTKGMTYEQIQEAQKRILNFVLKPPRSSPLAKEATPKATLDTPKFRIDIGGRSADITGAGFETDEGGFYTLKPDSRMDIEFPVAPRGTRVEAQGKFVTHQGAGIQVTGKPYYDLNMGWVEARGILDIGGQHIPGKITINEDQLPRGLQSRYTRPRAEFDQAADVAPWTDVETLAELVDTGLVDDATLDEVYDGDATAALEELVNAGLLDQETVDEARGIGSPAARLDDAEEVARLEILDQIGTMNVLAISGGRVRKMEHGIALPVSSGYSVEVELMPDDTYTVRRVFSRGGKRWEKGVETGVYADQVGDAAYRAGMYKNVPFGDERPQARLDDESYPDFDTVEEAGLDGTLRFQLGSGPEGQHTWRDVVRAFQVKNGFAPTESTENPDFDTVEEAGLDGTLRFQQGSGPDGQFTWREVAEAFARGAPRAELDVAAASDLVGAPTGGPSDNAVIKDSRKKGPAFALKFDRAKLDEMIKIVGITGNPKLHIKLYDQDMESGEQGMTRPTPGGGPDEFDVVVKVGQKVELKPHHVYIINNSLLHELRHVTQMQQDPGGPAGQLQKYVEQNMTVGYGNNIYEIDSRLYGHLAMRTEDNPDGSKELPDGFDAAQGEALWSMTPGEQIIEAPPGFVEHHGKPSGAGGTLSVPTGPEDPEIEAKFNAAKEQGTAEGTALLPEVQQYPSADRVQLLAQLKIEGLTKAKAGQEQHDADVFADSERLRRKYKALKPALLEGEQEQVDKIVADAGVHVPPHGGGGGVGAGGAGGLPDAIQQLMSLLGGGAPVAPSPDQQAIDESKDLGTEEGLAAVPDFMQKSPEEREAELDQLKQKGMSLANEAQTLEAQGQHEEAVAAFAQSEYTRRYRKELKKAHLAEGGLVSPAEAPAATLDQPIEEDDIAAYQAEDVILESEREAVVEGAPSLFDIMEMPEQDAIRAYQARAPEGTLVDVASVQEQIREQVRSNASGWVRVGAYDGTPAEMAGVSRVRIGDQTYDFVEGPVDVTEPAMGLETYWESVQGEVEDSRLNAYLDALQRAYARAYGAMWG